MKKIFIVGSCVSRDIFNYPNEEFEVVAYRARSSSATLTTPPVIGTAYYKEIETINSSFQQKMVLRDFKKSTLVLLEKTQYDGVLMDLIDERFHLGVINDSIVTRSNEFVASKIVPNRIISTFSDEFFELWKQGITLLLTHLADKKVILPKVYWASQAVGHNHPAFDQEQLKNIEAHNAKLERMYTYLAEERFNNLQIVDIDRSLLIANGDHKWGLSPFHYIDEYYLHMQQCLKALP